MLLTVTGCKGDPGCGKVQNERLTSYMLPTACVWLTTQVRPPPPPPGNAWCLYPTLIADV